MIRAGLAWLALCLLLAACGQRDDDAIRVGIPTAPLTLDPRYATDALSARVSRLLHAPLVEFDAAAQPAPGLASWRRLTPTRYEFTLRDDASFSNGRALVADDVVATYRAVLDAALASPLRDALRNIADVQAVDPRRVVFELRHADALFPGTLAVGVMAAEEARAPRDAWQLASGAFTREPWRIDGDVGLRRRVDGARIQLRVVKDATVRALQLIAGEIDIAQGNLPPEMLRWLAGRDGLKVIEQAGATMSYLGFNLSDPVLADRRVRQALSHGIDRAAIVHYLFRDLAQPAASLLPPAHWASPADIAVPSYDPALARQLLRAAGYGEKRLLVHYKTSADAFRLRLATLLEAQLRDIGVDLIIDSFDWGTFYADIGAGRFQLYGLSWVGLKLPDIYRQAFHSASRPPAGLNRGHYDEPELDALIEAAEQSSDETHRQLLYHAIARRLLYDAPYVPLWFETQTAVLRDDIADYSIDADGSFDGLRTVRRLTHHDRH
ncbi:MAG: ABC transporter substrate-binding protein [Gammaproteobacteria bacterium]|nr:ABC transporter substrate-binding protein [Gammaproteobacteria bacterium]